ncbi:PREDICTED: basal cell adhesion molecule [Hipposideros armiger]|uniref:Basal cell adhesion molecule n=1 Tax=Hipposideros armiger TaxID=186990 RepID=A0A8B7Q1N4_HIPAR|nr:PREDICTED: basal cell adhesion molecule [Hipposideros armiger]
MEPPDAQAGTRGAPQLLVLALLLGAHPGAQAEVQVSVPPLVEVMRGDPVTLDCTPLGIRDHFMLEWFLMGKLRPSKGKALPRAPWCLGTAETETSPPSKCWLLRENIQRHRESKMAGRGAKEREREGMVRTSEVTGASEFRILAQSPGPCLCLPQIATCNSRNGNPAPEIIWYRNGQPLQVPMEVNSESYMTSRTVREASGLQSLASTLYLRLHKADQDASFHCSVYYQLPMGQHGRLDSRPFRLTLHYPTEHVQFWVGSPSTTEGWVREGDSVHLFCRGDGSPSLEYTFYRLQDKEEKMLQTNFVGNFTLESVQRNQSGIYGCRVEDYDAAEDAELSQTLELRVAYLDPIDLDNMAEVSLPLGSSVATNCSVQGLPTPTLRWTKDSVPLGDGPTLSLNLITFDSAGTYICEASIPTVPLLSRTQVLQLLVEGSPELRPEEIQPKAEGSWREGDEVRLACSARGYPEPKLNWNHLGGSPTEPVPGGQGWVSSSLTLKVTSALSQEGVYCEASNPHGTTRHVFHFGTVAPQTSQAGVAVMAVAVSVGLLLLVVAAFYCMRRKGRSGRQREKGALPPGKPELSHSGSQRTEQTSLLTGGASGGARHGTGGFRDEC